MKTPFSTEDLALIRKAHEIATRAHEGQFRKDGKKYITHPEAVAAIVDEKFDDWTTSAYYGDSFLKASAIAAAYLHDVLEDTEVTEEDLKQAGITDLVISIVKDVTKQDENYFEFTMRVLSSNRLSRVVKLADLTHNMSDLQEGSMKDKYRFAYHILSK